MFEHEEAVILLISHHLECLYSSEHLHDPSLEGLVLFIDLPEFFLPIVLDDVIDVDLGSFEENFSLVGVGMHAYLYLFALEFDLFRASVDYLLFFGDRRVA